MNKLFTKIAALALGATMAVGVGVAVASTTKVRTAYASISPTEEAGLAVLTSSNFDASAEYVLKSTDGYYWNGVSGTSSSKWGGISKTLSDVARVTIDGTWADGFTIKDASDNYLRATTGNMTWATTQPGTFKMGSDSASNPIVYNGTSNGLKVNGTSGMRLYTNLTYNASTGKSVALYKIPVAKTLSNIDVKTAPTKTTYYAGEFFDPTGLELTATYSDSTTATIDYATFGSDFTFTPSTSTALTTSDVSVTIEYGGKSTTQAITVNAARTLSSITISGYTTTFDQGDSFTFGGTVTAHYSNSTTENVTASATFSGYNMSETGSQTVTVSYTEGGITETATYEITVNAVSSVTFVAGVDKSDTTSISKKGITVSLSGGTLSRDDNYRVYANNSLTITSTIGNIKSISLSLVTGNTGDFSPSYTNIGSSTWTESTTSQARITQIVVEIQPTVPTLELDKNTIDLKTNESAGKQVQATVFNVDNPSIVWTPNNNNVTIETGSIVDGVQTATIKPNTNVDASSTITVTVTGTTLSASITVSISVPEPGETPETAFTVAQARAHIDDVVEGGTATGNDGNYYYAAGIVSAIVTPYDSTYHNISYTISTDGLTSSTQLEAYRGKGLAGADFTSDDDLAVGDQVIIYGQLKIYNSTYEFDAGNYLYSQIPAPKVNSITLTPSIVEVAPEATGDIVDLFTSIVINQDQGSTKTVNDIVWSTGDENVFYVDGGEYLVAGEHKDSTTLYASIGGKVYGSATIEVVDPDHPFITYDEPISWSLASSLSVGDRVAIVYENGDTLVQLTGVSSNIGQIESYETAGNPNSSHVYTVGAGNAENSFTFSDGTSYLAYTSSATSGSNNLHTVTNPTGDDQLNQVSWTVEINDGSATVTNVYNTVRLLRYNTGSPRFACYAGGQQPVKFYKLTGGDVGTIDLDNTILTLVQSKMSNYQDEHGETQYGLSICNYNGGSDLSGWSTTVANGFTDNIISTYKLAYARSNRAGNDVEKFLSAYDYVVENYGASYDFLGRIASGKIVPSGGRVNPINTIISSESTSAVTIVVIVSLVSLTAIGGYFFIKRRKEN